MSAPDQVKLPRHVGLMGACGFVFGSIVGSGIFISPRGVFENAGSLGVGMLIWVAAGLLSTFGALCYVELGTMIPKSGGEFPILLESCGPLVAYLFAWTSTFMIKPAALSMLALTFAEYVLEPMYGNCGDVPLIGTKLTAAALIVFVVALNCFSTKASAKVVTLFTFGKVIGLSIIVVGGIIRLGQGYTSHFQDPFSGELPNVQQISASLFQGLWAFGGWNNLNSITEELKNPNKDMPRAIIASMVLVTGLYMLTNVAYFTVLSYDEILTTPAVGAKFGSEVMGPMSWVIPFSVACSLFGSSVGTTFTAGRIPYVAAREGLFNQVLSMIHVQRLTPTPSVLLGGVLSLILLVVGDFNSLLGYFSFAYWGYLFLAVASLLYFRWKMPDRPRPVKIPLFVPITFCLGSSYLVIASMVYHPKVEYLIALACMLFGLVFYIPFVYFRVTSKVIRFTNNFFQTLLMVILPDKD